VLGPSGAAGDAPRRADTRATAFTMEEAGTNAQARRATPRALHSSRNVLPPPALTAPARAPRL
jgi:hypothetical protein